MHQGNKFLSCTYFNWQVLSRLVTCDAINMDAYHILLGRPRQHDIDATHRGKRNIYTLTWEGKRISMKPIPPTPKPVKKRSQSSYPYATEVNS